MHLIPLNIKCIGNIGQPFYHNALKKHSGNSVFPICLPKITLYPVILFKDFQLLNSAPLCLSLM